MDKLRTADNAKDVLALIKPLTEVDPTKIRTDMYSIPATQMLHKCMFHETSRAKKEMDDDEDNVYSDEQQKLVYNRSNNSSVLKYIATNKITSSLGMKLPLYSNLYQITHKAHIKSYMIYRNITAL